MNCNADTMVWLYSSLVCPHLEYTCTIWSPHAGRAIAKMENVQKFGLRVASLNWSVSYIKDLVVDLGFPTLERRKILLKLCHLYKTIHKQCYFPPGLVNFKEISSYYTRSTNSLYLQQPFAHTTSYLHLFIPHSISIWNSLPNDIVNSSSFTSLKSKLSTYKFIYVL